MGSSTALKRRSAIPRPSLFTALLRVSHNINRILVWCIRYNGWELLGRSKDNLRSRVELERDWDILGCWTVSMGLVVFGWNLDYQ